MSTKILDFFIVTLPEVEYLPNKRIYSPFLSVEFADKALAEASLEHVRKRFPEAKIMRFRSEDESADDLERMERIEKRDEAYRQQLASSAH